MMLAAKVIFEFLKKKKNFFQLFFNWTFEKVNKKIFKQSV